MAKKSKKSETTVTVTTKHSVTNLCAFWGLAIAAVMFIVSTIIALVDSFGGGIPNGVARLMNILEIISEIALLVAVALPAYSYVRGKRRNWKIFYWVAFAIYALGVVFGVIAINW